jgi:Signal transduction histidine kinase
MKELSLNVLDLVQNSISAGARNISINIIESEAEDILSISINDDGCGMDEELLSRVADPFTTTRTTRRVGMGLPLFKLEAEMSGGSFNIESLKGRGTKVSASFCLKNIDRPPLGDMAATMTALIQGSPDLDFVYTRLSGKGKFVFSTAEIKKTLDGVPLAEPEVLRWIGEYIAENETALN